MRPYGTPRSTRRASRRLAPLALAAGLLVSATGCSSETVDKLQRGWLPEGVTNQSDRVTTLWVGSNYTGLAVGVFVAGLILFSAVRFRRHAGDTGLPMQVRYNLPIEVLYTAVPLIVVLVLFYFTARDESEIIHVSDNVDNEINVVGKRWSWDFNYVDADVYDTGTPAERPTLFLPEGESVKFTLTSRDVIHSFWVPAFLFKLDVVPGRVNTFEVTPTQQGTFAGKCAEFCGLDHSRMLFDVAIVSPEEYDAHLQQLRERGQTGQLPADLGPSLDVDENPATEREGQQ